MEVEVSLAKSTKDVEDAFKLVYSSYVEMGYIKENSSCMHIRDWNILPTSYIIIARYKSKIIGTVICIVDSPNGIPIDKVAVKQLGQLRAEGRKFCELSSLATSSEVSGTNIALKIFRYAYKLSLEFLSLSDFIIGINPSHEKFYKSILFFDPILSNASYCDMNNNPVTVLKADLDSLEMKFKERYENRKGESNLYKFFCKEQNTSLSKQIKSDIETYRKLLSKDLFQEFKEIYNSNSPII